MGEEDEGKEGQMVMGRDLTWGGEQIILCTGDVYTVHLKPV